jgi:hypothetical protein
MEDILQQELIPEFQRAVIRAFPEIAQRATMEVARRNGQGGRSALRGVLWRTSVVPTGGRGDDAFDRTMPVIDPVGDIVPNQAQYMATARRQRKAMCRKHLDEWNYYAMWFFDHEAKMCRFGGLWRSFTCGYLNQLLEQEYPSTNLPCVIRTEKNNVSDAVEHLDRDFTFIGVAYRNKLPEMWHMLRCECSYRAGGWCGTCRHRRRC